ncbi:MULTISPECIES: peptide deformylase [unclassified Adlercreutzia]|uniref:peptide deformylase n=1 Tax=unclassified Adlercreutzia TaxID=2636013 RepID=UPI0013ECABF5|nr:MULTISPECIES: peptide deformylase [unclassified Adlercreutzia]
MAVKEIIKDEDILSKPCEKCTDADAALAQDLLDTVAATEDMACLAANQIGETKAAICYVDDNDEPHVMFNPVMKRALAPFKTVEECFSVDEPHKVTRFQRMTVEYDELVDGKLVPRKREFRDWTAQVIQHGIDHTKGKVI